jgi:hypothetical protein
MYQYTTCTRGGGAIISRRTPNTLEPALRPVWYDLERIKDVYRGTTVLGNQENNKDNFTSQLQYAIVVTVLQMSLRHKTDGKTKMINTIGKSRVIYKKSECHTYFRHACKTVKPHLSHVHEFILSLHFI